MRRSCCKKGYGEDLCRLVEILVSKPYEYFDKKDCLNSDGRRLLESIIRLLLHNYRGYEFKHTIRFVRKNPCLPELIRFADIFYQCNLLKLYVIGREYIALAEYEPYVRPWKRVT